MDKNKEAVIDIEAVENLEAENKIMADFLAEYLGFTKDELDQLCYCSEIPSRFQKS